MFYSYSSFMCGSPSLKRQSYDEARNRRTMPELPPACASSGNPTDGQKRTSEPADAPHHDERRNLSDLEI
jgi:hypothetical protein